MIEPQFTPKVKRIADDVRRLSIGELVALREALRLEFDILPPDIGDREPRVPLPPGPRSSAAVVDPEDE